MTRCGRLSLCLLVGVWADAALAADQPADLKVSRVALFSSGVGFFEREAMVDGAAAAELKFRTQQINDILKSLVVQDLDGGAIGIVSFASKDPLERTLKSFAVDLTDDPSLADLLGQLRGEPVHIAGPRQMAGTILGVELQQVPGEKDRPPITVAHLNVLTDAGFEHLRIDQLQGIKLTNEKIDAELRKALTTLASGHDADKKSVTVRFEGQGQRRVRASFLLEAPIWKTSYRLVLGPDQKPFLQGWATVENATEEDWKDVRLSLVSGRPISFQMDLYTPIYIPRPQEDLELYASLRAPDFEAGFGKFGFGGMGGGMGGMSGAGGRASRPMEEAEGRAEGEKTVMLRRKAPAAAEARRGQPADGAPAEAVAERARGALADLSDSGVHSVAAAQEAGELFEYVIQTPVSIARQNSAMLPIVNEAVAGQKVSIFNPASHAKHPLNGLIMENTTALNLMQGPVTVFDSEVYAGDAKLPDLKAGEKRLVAYALDLSMDIMTEAKPTPDDLVSLRIAKGVLYHKHRRLDERTYTAHNKDKKDRVLIIEQGYSQGWNLLEPKEPLERTQNLHRFRVAVPAGKEAKQSVKMERVADQAVAVSELGLDVIQYYIKTPVISPAVKAAMEKTVALRTELDQVARDRGGHEKAAKEAVEEQARIRENLKTIQQNTDTYQRQLKKFDSLETQIEQLRTKVEGLRQQEEIQRKALEAYLLALNVE